MQAVVDFRGWFMDAYIGWPGKVHDARVLVNSSLYCKAMSGTLTGSEQFLVSRCLWSFWETQPTLLCLG